MTCKARLDQLLLISVKKSNAFIDIVRTEVGNDTPAYVHARTEWEAAEHEYVSMLKYMDAARIKPTDSTSAIINNLRTGIRSLMMMFF